MKRILLAIMLSLLPMLGYTAQEATVVRDTTLYEQPQRDAPRVAELPAETPVSIKTRKGAWYQIATPKGEGWVSITTLRLKVAVQTGNDGGGSLGQLAGGGGLFSTGRGNTSEARAATGLKGLEDTAIAPAANRNTLTQQLLDQIAVPGNQARGFAQQGSLQSRQLAYPDSITLEPEPPPGEVIDKQQRPAGKSKKDDNWDF